MSDNYSEGPKLNFCNDGLYLPCSIAGVKVNCLHDTGANTSIIHPKIYYSIQDSATKIYFSILESVTNSNKLY